MARCQPALAKVAAASARQRLDPVETVAKVVVAAVLHPRPKRLHRAGNARVFGVPGRLPRGARDRMVTRALGLSGPQKNVRGSERTV